MKNCYEGGAGGRCRGTVGMRKAGSKGRVAVGGDSGDWGGARMRNG